MDALIIYPENREQLSALKAVVKAMKISFEQKSMTLPNHVIEGVKLSAKQADEHKLTPYNNIADLLG